MEDQKLAESSQCCETAEPTPRVTTASFVRTPNGVVATIDGEEINLPGASMSTGLEGDAKNGVRVHFYATFIADKVDITTETAGS